jgi:hypothetical protein
VTFPILQVLPPITQTSRDVISDVSDSGGTSKDYLKMASDAGFILAEAARRKLIPWDASLLGSTSVGYAFAMTLLTQVGITGRTSTTDLAHEFFQGSSEQRSEQINMVSFGLRWHQYGLPTLKLSQSLTAALLLTECRGLTGRDLKMPFPSFVLELPGPDHILSLRSLPGKPPSPVTHILVHGHTTGVDHANNTQEMANLTRELLVGTTSVTAFLQTALAQARAPQRQFLRVSLLARDMIMVSRTDPQPSENAPLETWLAGDSGLMNIEAEDLPVIRAALRLVTNCCLYLEANALGKPLSKPKHKAPKRRDESVPNSSPTVWEVGNAVKLPRALRDAARDLSGEGGRKAWRVHARFAVRGHWRNQAHGPKRSERKRIWVQPFWKGPETGATLLKLYEAQTLSGEEPKK